MEAPRLPQHIAVFGRRRQRGAQAEDQPIVPVFIDSNARKCQTGLGIVVERRGKPVKSQRGRFFATSENWKQCSQAFKVTLGQRCVDLERTEHRRPRCPAKT